MLLEAQAGITRHRKSKSGGSARGPVEFEKVGNRSNSLQRRLAALRDRHGALDLRIGLEQRRPLPNSLRIQQLKRLRLRIKDEIESIMTLLRDLRRKIARKRSPA